MLALTLATLAVYWQVQFHDFINYDDPLYVDNPTVRLGLTWEGICWAFQSIEAANWHPLTWISHMMDFQLFGKKPAGHHLTNLFFHIANSLLLFLLLKEMTSSVWRSAVVAAMFALHPLHVESVAWVSERKDVLSSFLFLLTLAAYGKYVKIQNKAIYLATFLFFVLGLLAKPMLVTLPFILLLLDFWPLKRIPCTEINNSFGWQNIRPLLIEKIPFFICAIISSIITFHAQSQGGAVNPLKIVPISVRISNSFISYVEYLNKTFWPRDLAVFYPYPDVIFLSKAAGAALIIIFISTFAFWSIKRLPYLFVGWFWYLGTLVPVIGLVQVGIQALADRYTYIPHIGIFIALSWGVAEMTKKMPYRKIILSTCAVLLLTHWSLTAWRQVSYWKDSITLLEYSLSVTADNAVLRNNLGLALAKANREDEAMQYFKAVLLLDPNHFGAFNNIGLLLDKRGQTEEARKYYERSIEINPRNEAALMNLGANLAATGAPEYKEKALNHFLLTIEINPQSYHAHFNAGKILSTINKEKAIQYFKEAIRLNPDYGMAHFMLGIIYFQKNLKDKATFHINEALKCDVDPALAFLHVNISDELLRQGEFDEALNQLEKALKINPNSAENHYKLGNLFKMKGKLEEANHRYNESLRIDPEYYKAKNALSEPAPAITGAWHQ